MTVSNTYIIEETDLPIGEKYALSIKEAAAYFGIGDKKLRRLVEQNPKRFSFFSGNKYLIIRKKFETFLEQSYEV